MASSIDPAQVLLEVGELKAQVASMNERFTVGFEHLTRVVDDMRLEQKVFRDNHTQVVVNTQNIDRAFTAIGELATEVKTITHTVKGFNGGLRGAKWVFGVVSGLLLTLCVVAFNSKMELANERLANLKETHSKDVQVLQTRLKVVEDTHQLEYGPGQQVRP